MVAAPTTSRTIPGCPRIIVISSDATSAFPKAIDSRDAENPRRNRPQCVCQHNVSTGIHVLFASFTDFEFVVTDPVVATVGVPRLFDPGDRKEVSPERVGAVYVLAHAPSWVAAAIRPAKSDRPRRAAVAVSPEWLRSPKGS